MKTHQHLFLPSLLNLLVLFGGGSTKLFVLGQEEGDGPLCGDIYYTHQGAKGRDPVSEMGGLQNIDKIIAIEVDTAHNLLFCNDNRVIGRVATTYRLNDGSQRRVVYGDGGHCAQNDLPVINIPEGVYLTRISGYDGGYLDQVQFHMSDGSVFKPYASSAFPGINFDYSGDKAVIKAVSICSCVLFVCIHIVPSLFLFNANCWINTVILIFVMQLTFDSGNIVDGIGAHFEHNRVRRYEMGDDVVVEQLGGTELTEHGVNIDGSQEGALNVFDNLDGDTTVSYDRKVTQVVKEWETRTVTSHRQTDVTFNLNVEGIYKGVKAEANFFVGHSTSETEVTDEGFEREKTLEEQVAFDVEPGTKKIVHLAYRTYEYEYRFSGTAQCIYLAEPDTVYPGGIAEGELLGSEALTGIIIEIDTVTKDDGVLDTSSEGGGSSGSFEANALDASSGNSIYNRSTAAVATVTGIFVSLVASWFWS